MKNITLKKKDRDELQKLANIDRYNNAIKIHHESVAEHSFYVAIYADIISELLGLPYLEKYLVLYSALTHDIAEIKISDVPHNIKENNPELKSALEKAEKEFNAKYIDTGAHTSKGFANLRKFIVDCADILSVIQYSETEVEIGNSFFIKIYCATRARYESLIIDAYKSELITKNEYEVLHSYSVNKNIERKVNI